MTSPTTPTTASGPAAGDILTKAEAATFLGIAPRTLDDWRKAKVLPVIERPGYVRFLRADLVAFIERHRVEARKAPAYRPRRKRGAAAGSSSTPVVTGAPATP